ncbi:MAG TPA: amidase [Pseudonocardia sp.]|uniref:amidase n=1 Tax=Pseudonocardia sp. TaxID=60912 RepID=UPI002EDA6F75
MSIAESAPTPSTVSTDTDTDTGIDLADATAAELLELFAAGTATPTQATQACLDRIEATEPSVNAVITLLAERALTQAAESDERWAAGTARPLEGVPYGLKDIVATQGIPTTGGSALYRDYLPSTDAVLATRLAEAGGVLLAKLATFEFACGGAVNKTFGPTRNPWDPRRTTGGSSSGSGAAVALGQVPLAIGTDTGGSIRIPSAFCGLTGIKPTYGRVPRHGVMGLSWTMDHAGPMARSVADCALMLDVIAGPDPLDPTALPAEPTPFAAALDRDVSGMRVARARGYVESNMHPEIAAAYQTALTELAGLGVEIVDVELPSFELATLAGWTIIYAEMLSLHEGHFDGIEDRDEMGASLLGAGPFVSASDYLRALRLRPLFQRELAAAMDGFDALVTPGMTALPPMIAPSMISDVGGRHLPWLTATCQTNAPFNVTGSPALVLPSGQFDGMPLSMQLVGRPRDESTLFALGAAYQRATDHHLRRPPVLAAA